MFQRLLQLLVPQVYAQADSAGTPADVFGSINPPAGVEAYGAGEGNIGLLIFISRIIQVITIAAGIWAFINIALAGIQLVTQKADPGAYQKAIDRIVMSVIGLIIIVASYTIAGLIGLILFGDPTYFLNPQLVGPGGS